jgi:hypothetical protein
VYVNLITRLFKYEVAILEEIFADKRLQLDEEIWRKARVELFNASR